MLKLMFVPKDLYPSFNDYQNSGLLIRSETLHNGYLECKNSPDDQWKYSNMVLRRLTLLDNEKKLYLESMDNEHKTIFLIDLDNVDQIDLSEKKRVIYLKRIESNEACLLSSRDKINLKEWLKILCKNCGFHESHRTKSSKKPRTLRELLNRTCNETNRMRKLTVAPKISQCLIAGSNYVNTKSSYTQIAGLASPLVGSSTECQLFKVVFASNKENKPDYLCLDECQSGVDDTKADSDVNLNSSSLIDLSLFEDQIRKKINYVPLEVVNSRNDINIILDSNSQLSDSSSVNNEHKIYDFNANKSFTFCKKSNVSNTNTYNTNSDISYSYLDPRRTDALKSTIKGFNRQF